MPSTAVAVNAGTMTADTSFIIVEPIAATNGVYVATDAVPPSMESNVRSMGNSAPDSVTSPSIVFVTVAITLPMPLISTMIMAM